MQMIFHFDISEKIYVLKSISEIVLRKRRICFFEIFFCGLAWLNRSLSVIK